MTRATFLPVFVALGTIVAFAQPAPITLTGPVVKVFDALYLQTNIKVTSAQSDAATEAAVRRALSSMSGAELDDFAAMLLQFEIPPVDKRIRAYYRSRPDAVMPYLKKYRDTPFKLPPKYKYSMRLPPSSRRSQYDEVIAQLEHHSFHHGLDPKVDALVVPVLNVLKGPPKGELPVDIFVPADKIFNSKTPQADEALVVLLDYITDAHYEETLTMEVVRRGKRMLPLLRKYQSSPTFALAASYPQHVQEFGIERAKRFEWFIEVIELGEVFDH